MKKIELIQLIGEKKLKKSLGQNLLLNEGVAEKMVKLLEGNNEDVLEIGAGTGIVTEKLLLNGLIPYCIEIDEDFCKILKERFGEKINLFCGDFFQFPPEKFRGKLITGSLPYRGGKKIISHILMNYNNIRRATFLLQKEVAEVVVSSPGKKTYSPLSVILKLRGDAKIVMNVSPASFFPEPKVISSLILLELENPPPDKGFYTFVKIAFRSRRKNLRNNLKPYIKGFPDWFPVRERAERISPGDFYDIYRRLMDEGLLPSFSET